MSFQASNVGSNPAHATWLKVVDSAMIDNLDIIFNKLMQFGKEYSDETVYPYFVWNQQPYISIADMEDGGIYYGSCRNASFAVWNGTEFLHVRYKFGYYLTNINHIIIYHDLVF